MNLFEILKQSNFDFFFISIDKFLTIQIPQLDNFFTITPQTLKINLDINNSGKFLSHPQTISFIKEKISKSGHQAVIIPFKPSGKIEHICQKEGWIYAANPAKLNRLIEDKINFFNLCQKYSISTIPSIIDTFNQENFQKYQQILDNNLVIQSRFGWAGKSTFSSPIWETIKDKIPQGTPVKYSPLIYGYSIINNCCLTKSGLIQSPPGLQYTGLPQFTQNPFTTVGRQWPSFTSLQVGEKIKNLTLKFSEILQNLNYKGFFGLDFFVRNDEVFVLECNPRLTASFDLYHQIETKNNINSLFLFHLISFLPINIDIDINHENKRFYDPTIIGSEITNKDSHNNTISRYRDFIAFSSQNDPVCIPSSIIQAAHEVKE